MPSQPQQAQESFADLRFPLGGIDLSRGFNNQLPRPLQNGDYGGTTPLGQNVRGYEPGTRRARGGQRPGLLKYIQGLCGSASLIQELNLVVGVGYAAPGPGGSGYYFAQTPAVAPAGTLASVATFAAPVTAGNAIVVASAGSAFPTITDGAGNHYTSAVSASVSYVATSIWYATNVTGGFSSVTCTYAATPNATFVFEIGNLNNSTPVDVTAANSSTGSASGNYGTMTTTRAGDLIIGASFMGDDFGSSHSTITSGPAGFIILTNANNQCQGIYLPAVASGTALTPAFVINESTTWIASMAAFRQVGV